MWLWPPTPPTPSERAGLDIPDSFWKMMEDLVPVPHPLAEATEILGCEDKPTRSSVYALAHGLVSGALWPCDQDSAAIGNVKTKIHEGMANRMSLNDNGTPKQLLVHHTYMMAAFLTAATRQYCHNSLEMTLSGTLTPHYWSCFPCHGDEACWCTAGASEAGGPASSIQILHWGGRFWTLLTMAMTLPTLPEMRWKRLLRALLA